MPTTCAKIKMTPTIEEESKKDLNGIKKQRQLQKIKTTSKTENN